LFIQQKFQYIKLNNNKYNIVYTPKSNGKYTFLFFYEDEEITPISPWTSYCFSNYNKLQYQSDFDKNGLFYFLLIKYKKEKNNSFYDNIHPVNLLDINYSTINENFDHPFKLFDIFINNISQNLLSGIQLY
jgi:hypothetical protein